MNIDLLFDGSNSNSVHLIAKVKEQLIRLIYDDQ